MKRIDNRRNEATEDFQRFSDSSCFRRYLRALRSLTRTAPRRPDSLEERLLDLRGSGEDAVGILAVSQHLGVDPIGAIQVQSTARQILKPQVAIAIDLGVGQPGRKVRRLSGEGGEQVDGG